MSNLKWAKEAKQNLDIPVSVVGAFSTPEMADKAIARGDVDMVAFGRPFLADPYWPKKAMENHPEDIVPCLRCSNCYHISTDHWNVGCSVNPRCHCEDFLPKNPGRAEVSKRVVIIGGGPAGMKAAITASDRGHQVTLLEKNSALGGMLRFIVKEAHKEGVKRLLD